MAFSATKRELGELYTFFRLLADGAVSLGTPKAEKDETLRWPVALIQREEHDGTRRYYIEAQEVRVVSGTAGKDGSFVPGEKEELRFPREDFGDAAELVLHLLKNVSGEEVEMTEGLEAFLDAVNIFDLEAKTEDRTDFSVAFWHPEAPLTGFNVRCRLTPMNPLLDGGRTANLKLEQSGVKFAVPTVNKVNALPESPTEVAERMMMIERLGGVLKYADVADRVFRCNLLMIDLHFPPHACRDGTLDALGRHHPHQRIDGAHQGDESVEDKGRVDKQAPLLRVQDEAVPAGTCPRHAPCQNL